MSAQEPTQKQKEACWQYMDDFSTCNRAWLQTRNYYLTGGDLLDCSRHYKLVTACLSDQSPFFKDKEGSKPSALEVAKLEHPVWKLNTREEAQKAWEQGLKESMGLAHLASWSRLSNIKPLTAIQPQAPVNAQRSSLYRVERFMWTNSRSQKLCVYAYRCQKPSAVVFFHHGLFGVLTFEALMCFSLPAHRKCYPCQKANVDVFGYDMHGHGLSEPTHPDGRVCILSAQHLLDDAQGFLDEIVLPAVRGASQHKGKSDESTGQHGEGVDTESAAHIKCLPLYGVAHSLGGGVLTLVESKRPGTFAGLALNAPALGRHVTLGDRVSLVIINMLRMLCPLAQLIPSTPWHRITDDHAIPHLAESDAHYFNGALRVVTAHSLAKFFLMLNAAAAANSVSCPMYVQWAGSEVLTCRTAAERWRTSSHDYVTPATPPNLPLWSSWLGDIPGTLWVLLFGRRGAEEGSRSSQYGTKAVNANSSAAGSEARWSVRGRLRKLRKLKWEEVKDGAMHVMIHGRRGPALVACIRNWLLQQIDAVEDEEAGCEAGRWNDRMHASHAYDAALEEHRRLAAAGASHDAVDSGHRGSGHRGSDYRGVRMGMEFCSRGSADTHRSDTHRSDSDAKDSRSASALSTPPSSSNTCAASEALSGDTASADEDSCTVAASAASHACAPNASALSENIDHSVQLGLRAATPAHGSTAQGDFTALQDGGLHGEVHTARTGVGDAAIGPRMRSSSLPGVSGSGSQGVEKTPNDTFMHGFHASKRNSDGSGADAWRWDGVWHLFSRSEGTTSHASDSQYHLGNHQTCLRNEDNVFEGHCSGEGGVRSTDMDHMHGPHACGACMHNIVTALSDDLEGLRRRRSLLRPVPSVHVLESSSL